MTSKQLNAWILYKQCSGDTSLKVHFFTRELGLVTCLCKGGRTPKKQALLQPFTPLWVDLVARYGHHYSKGVESLGTTVPLEGHSLFSALYINELLHYTLKPNYPDESLFDAYLTTLQGIASTNHRLTIERLLRRFEWTLLHACGHAFSFTQEACSDNRIMPGAYYQLYAGEGFKKAAQGIAGEHLHALANDDLTRLEYLQSAKKIMRIAIDHLLCGREIKARALYLST